MVQLLSLHGWTQKARFSHQKSRSLSVVKAPLAKIRDKGAAANRTFEAIFQAVSSFFTADRLAAIGE